MSLNTVAKSSTPPYARYVRGTLTAMIYYVVAIVAVVLVADRNLLSGIWLYMLAAQPGGAIAIQIWVTLRYLREADEYVRTLLAKRLIVAAMGAMAIMTVWGFLETFAGVVHIPGWYVYLVMWGLFGLASLFIRDSK